MKPVSRRQAAASSGPRVDGHAEGFQHIGRAAREVTARLPCLATLAPAAAATSAAPEEMLKVSGPPPPVPHDVHQLVALFVGERNRRDARAHDLDKAGQLRGLFAARGQHGEQRGGFDFRHVAGQDFCQARRPPARG